MASEPDDVSKRKPTTVVTTIDIDAEPAKVWRLLCDATLPLAPPWWFRLGVPTPQKCELPSGPGTVGARRKCTTNQGFIQQRITEWADARRLSFEREEDSLGLGTSIDSLKDTFELAPLPSGGTRLTRTSHSVTRRSIGILRACVLGFVVKRIHHFVMRNFKAVSEAVPDSGEPAGPR